MADCWVLSRTWGFVFLWIFVFLGIFINEGLTWALFQEIAIKSVVFERTRTVSSNFSNINFFRFDRMMFFMLFALTLHIPQSSTDIVWSRTRKLFAFVFTCINKVDFIRYVFELVFLLGPVHADSVVTGWRAVVLLLTMGYIIEVGLLLGSLAL